MSTEVEVDKKIKRSRLEEVVRNLHYTQQEEEKNKLGKVLTIVDAAFSDPEQRKAVKDLVKNAYYEISPIGTESQYQKWIRFYAETEGIELFPDEKYATYQGEINPLLDIVK